MSEQFIKTIQLIPINNYKIKLYQCLSLLYCGYKKYKIKNTMPLFTSLLENINKLNINNSINKSKTIIHPYYYQNYNNSIEYIIPVEWFQIRIIKNQIYDYYIKYFNENYFIIYAKHMEPLYEYTKTRYM